MQIFVEFAKDVEALKIFDETLSEIITHVVGAKLGVTETDSVYIFLTKNAQLTDVEGVTYGDDWPQDSAETFTLYDIASESMRRDNRPVPT